MTLHLSILVSVCSIVFSSASEDARHSKDSARDAKEKEEGEDAEKTD